MPLSVCVFCASARGLQAVHHRAARELGGELARRGHRLVYGGGNVGLMGELARAVRAAGGSVVGAIPRMLVDKELADEAADELVVTETLRERKAEMDARADAFLTLPGGFGTLEELLEVLTLRQLAVHDRPIVLLNTAGYWEPFLAMVEEIVAQGFAPAGRGRLFEVAATPAEALDLIERGAAAAPRAAPPGATAALVEDWTALPGESAPGARTGTAVER